MSQFSGVPLIEDPGSHSIYVDLASLTEDLPGFAHLVQKVTHASVVLDAEVLKHHIMVE